MANEVKAAFDTAFRDFVTEGVPSSGVNPVRKSEARNIGPVIDEKFTELYDAIDVASAGTVLADSWATLATIEGTRAGQPAQVPTGDEGTHTDPVVGGTVANSGNFTWVIEEGWQRVSDFQDVNAIAAEVLGARGDDETLGARLDGIAGNGIAVSGEVVAARRNAPQLVGAMDLKARRRDIASTTSRSMLARGRLIMPETWTFDLKPETGKSADGLGIPWNRAGSYDRAINVNSIIIDGRLLWVWEWSADLKPLVGIWDDTGSLYSAGGSIGGSTVNPELVAKVTSGTIDLYRRQGGPSSTAYLQWRIELSDFPERNSYAWRTSRVFEASLTATEPTLTFTQGMRIFHQGEMEMAVKFVGRFDFIGGYTHGNEIASDFRMLVDGSEVDVGTEATYVPQYGVEMFQHSAAHEGGAEEDGDEGRWPDPIGPVIFNVVRRWLFRPQGEFLRLSTRVAHAIGGYAVNRAYFGMGLMERISSVDGITQISHTAIRSPAWQTEDVSTIPFDEVSTTADEIRLWGDRYGMSMRMTKGWSYAGRRLRIWDSPNYNKIYPDFFGGKTTTENEIWDVEAEIDVSINTGVAA